MKGEGRPSGLTNKRHIVAEMRMVQSVCTKGCSSAHIVRALYRCGWLSKCNNRCLLLVGDMKHIVRMTDGWLKRSI